jgi:hypothetical protein
MDWTSPLKSQQTDFVTRLRFSLTQENGIGCTSLLACARRGLHGETVKIAGDRLKQLRSECRQLVLQSEQSVPVRDLFRHYLRQQLARETLATYLDRDVVALMPEQQQQTQRQSDFVLRDRPEVGIRVKWGTGSLDTVRWSVGREESQHNSALVFVWLPDAVDENLDECHLVLAGFLPASAIGSDRSTNNIPQNGHFEIASLLYVGGLRAYLHSIRSDPPSWGWLRYLTSGSSYVYPIAISASGRIVASSGYDGSIKLWHLENAQLCETLAGQSWSFYPIAGSSGGQSLTSGSTDKQLSLWQLSQGKLMRSLGGHSSGVSSLAIASGGHILASGGYDGTVRLWQLPEGRLLHTIAAHSATVRPITIGADNHILASSSTDKTIKLWKLETGDLIRTIAIDPDPVVAIAISPDGQIVASGAQDGKIQLWHLPTGQLQRTFMGHSGTIRSMTISENGQLLASGSTERTIKLWDMETGELKRTITGYPDPLVTVAPDPSRERLDLNLFRHHHPGWIEPSQW